MKLNYTQLLVHLDATPASGTRLNLALRLAEAQGAAVTALYAVTPALIDLPFTPEIGPGLVQSLQEVDDARRARARAVFDATLARPGVHASWSQVDGEPIVGAFAEQALYADLMLLGQYQPGAQTAQEVPADFAESVVGQSGRGALVLPYASETATCGEIVVIGWKPTREAMRAVMAAMPLLQRARQVHVLSWGGDPSVVSGRVLDLTGLLRLYGVEAQWHREGGEPAQLGDALLSRSCDLGADLLVMGCYGHSRAREWVLGGTSRTVLESMTLPVLLAH